MNTKPSTTPTRTVWRKSSYSTGTGNCVEVAPEADGAVIRHSKHPTAGTITFPRRAWTAFIREATEDLTSPNGIATITKIGTETLVESIITGIALRFDEAEWSAFVAGVADGEFNITSEHAATS